MQQFPAFRPQAVPSYPPGHVRNPIKPHHTPSLLEMLGINPHKDSAKAWCEFCAAAVKASRQHREGVKVTR